MNECSVMSNIHTNDSSPSTGDAGSPVYCVIGNIPAELHSADLRSFFSQMTELGGFQCFHYRHRPEVNPSSTSGAASSSFPAPSSTCCCVVSVRRTHLVELLRNYDKKLWVDRAGKYVRASRVHISQLKTGPEGAADRTGADDCDADTGATHELPGGGCDSQRPVSTAAEGAPRSGGPASEGGWSGVPRGPIRTVGESTAVSGVDGAVPLSCASQRHAECDASRSQRHATPEPSNDNNGGGGGGGDITDGQQQQQQHAAVDADDGDTLDLQQLLKLPELRPPAVLPCGNVGTSNGVLLDLIAQCKMPARLITKLGLEFPKAKRPHRYSSVPFQYEALRGLRPGRRGKRPQPSASTLGIEPSAAAGDHQSRGTSDDASRRSGAASAATAAAAGCSASLADVIVWRTGDGHRIRDDDPDIAAAAKTTTATMATTRVVIDDDAVIVGETSTAHAGESEVSDREDDDDDEEEEEEALGEEDDHDAEEWDRHEALHDDVDKQGRTEERLFENEIELKWEKGGSGLVFYTDAAYWDDMKGEEDERLADDYNVDYSVFYDPGSGTKDAMDVMDMAMETQRRAGKDVDDWRTKAGFENFTKGFGGRVLRDQGWKSGAGLGRKEQGISEPVEADGQAAYDKRGLGYFGEKLRRNVSGAKRPQRHVTSKYDAPDYVDTMLRTRGPLAQKRRCADGSDGGGHGQQPPPAKRHVNEEGNVAKINN